MVPNTHPASPIRQLAPELVKLVFAWLPVPFVVRRIAVVCKNFREYSKDFPKAAQIDRGIDVLERECRYGLVMTSFGVLADRMIKLNLPEPMLVNRLTRLLEIRPLLPATKKPAASQAILRAALQLPRTKSSHIAQLVAQDLDEYATALARKKAGQAIAVPALGPILQPGVAGAAAAHKLAVLDWLLQKSSSACFQNVMFVTTELMDMMCPAVAWTRLASDSETRIALLENLIRRFQERCFDRFNPSLQRNLIDHAHLEAVAVKFGGLACAAMDKVPLEKRWELLMMLPEKSDQCLLMLSKAIATVDDEDFIVAMPELEMAMRFGSASSFAVVQLLGPFAKRIEMLCAEERDSVLQVLATNYSDEREETRDCLFWIQLKAILPAFATLVAEQVPAGSAETVDEGALTDTGE